MAFESLQDKLQSIFKKISGQARLSEANIEEMLQEVRLALLDADVNNEVVKSFISELHDQLIGQEVTNKLNPSQMVVKIVDEQITELLGGTESEIDFKAGKRTIVMMVGLQGGGKTTSCAKLAKYAQTKYKCRPILVALDIYRPGAIDQLEQLAKANDFGFYCDRNNKDVCAIAEAGIAYAKAQNYDTIILDTAGRLHIDENLMEELKNLKAAVNPNEIILVVDAMGGQEAANSSARFNELLKVSGAIMTKLDSDARGGAALSMAKLSGIHIRYAATGEKVDEFDLFHPKRMAERILGMGDLLALIEKAQASVDEKRSKSVMQRMMTGRFDLEDMLYQLESANKMGPLGAIAKLMPGMPKLSEADQERAEQRLKKNKAVIYSMTIDERRHPEILKNDRKERIAKGSGMQVSDVNMVLRQYEQSKLMMKKMIPFLKSGGKLPIR